jgi:hypothetical protein
MSENGRADVDASAGGAEKRIAKPPAETGDEFPFAAIFAAVAGLLALLRASAKRALR